MTEWRPGIYEHLLTEADGDSIDRLADDLVAEVTSLADAEAADRLSRHVARLVARLVADHPEAARSTAGAAFVQELIDHLAATLPAASAETARAARLHLVPTAAPRPATLHAVQRCLPTGAIEHVGRPLTPLLDTTLLTNASGEPALAHELRAEIDSAQRIDVLMAFIRFSGIRPMLDELRRHCARQRELRVITTTYTGTTEARALDELAALGAEVRVSYDETSTRLHAKAFIFHRGDDTTTAYLGSSNLTHSAQHAGLEWNIRVASARNPDVIDKMRAAFEVHWHSRDVRLYDAEEFRRRQAAGADSTGNHANPLTTLPPTDVELRPYQEVLLERIAVARAQGRHRNLLVAATGTGKTVMAAVDFARMCTPTSRPRLLFVAHRRELLQQGLATYRHALRDAAFGELWVGDDKPKTADHLFASVQSLSARGITGFAPDHFHVVVVDEFHHAEAPTYRALLEHLQPAQLLGLTATPDRADGLDVLRWFDGRIAAELRLWEAVSGGYLAPFAYYGVADATDFSGVPWTRGRGYDPGGLTGVLTADHAWAHLVVEQVRRHVADPATMRALGFCVSVGHARFMAERFSTAGIPSVAVSGESHPSERQAALDDLRAGRVAAIFTVDLFNEGVDVPAVDTLLMLRPTDSGTLFIQQLGRGLRRHPGKSVCTVIDLVANHRREFRYDLRFRSLLGGTRRQLEAQVEAGFPFLPAGCSLELDAVASATVLRSIRGSLPSTWRAKVAEAKATSEEVLGAFLTSSGLELDDVYDQPGHGWSVLRRAA
ncbi:MAG TPA: DEAD/DEAH box helicase family protein, partial [Acidimicrobiales bacterium]|nr:DEAD/DEAH box helicase family protein [Acidimicrobiales bacterium]